MKTALLSVALSVLLFSEARAQSSPEPESSFALRLQQRTRYESLNDQYRPMLSGSDQALALQTSVYFDGRLKRLRFLGELFDARTLLNDEGSYINTTMVDTLEPLQASVAWTFDDALVPGATSSLTAGRFTMDVGRRRLIARSGFRNSLSSFTGLDWQWDAKDGRTARAFYVVPMRILPSARDELLDDEQELDRGNRDTSLSGLYYDWAPFKHGDRAEVYWLGLNQAGRPQNDAPARDIGSVGFRIFRPRSPGRWSYEVEGVLQRGESSASAAGVLRSELEHDAEFFHWEFGYAFKSSWSPTLLLQYDVASGDQDPFDGRNQGFDTLFGERRFDFAPPGIYGAFTRGNLLTPGLRLTMARKRWQGMLSYRMFELEQARDTWVGVGLRDLSGQAGRSLGTQLEGSFAWAAIDEHLDVEVGFAQLEAGRFVREVSGSAFRGNPTYFYFVLTTNF